MRANKETEGDVTSFGDASNRGKGKESLFASADDPSSDDNNRNNKGGDSDGDSNCNPSSSSAGSLPSGRRPATRNASSKYDFVKVPFLFPLFYDDHHARIIDPQPT